MQPHEYPRRILFCVAGMTPQIITETLYALAVETDGRPPFVPTEIRVLSTSTGAEQVRLALLAGDRDQFGALCREYGLRGIRFDPSMVEVITGPDGRPLADIRSPEENECAADAITRTVAELTRDPDCAVHVSIAGGRKTMGFYAGYALSLYGRQQDRLSHVLVNERFEQLRDFYFKPRNPVTIKDSRGLEVSTADARIHLAEIPFVALAEGLHKPLLDRSMGYAETVRLLRRSSSEGVLLIDCARGLISWQGMSLQLTNAQLPIYLWFAERRRRGLDDGWVSKRSIAYDREMHLDLVRCARRHLDKGGRGQAADQVDDVFTEPPQGFDGAEWMAPHLSRIKQRIVEHFGPAALSRIGIESDNRRRNQTAYRLTTPPELIRIESARRES
ncbi:MAG: hypothetical protein KatS3mg126_1895 [Lysobacteraceae bacterium]|nr:MAG: hypothetical protein KatS3mg126_1895 [Xanthomonadaceae bacterium]